ncbi:hypothetical protein RHGRI_006638 [Rhododendron griersonianum]|uniref:Uncharacterized protein n=1 Tax=Rhododendron griersonianum TaxID=479676 RepID=A0AAV6KV03_9ERIC|nr:hypothetical protein RHGRI_006638 [Rhododendron griersonianum]
MNKVQYQKPLNQNPTVLSYFQTHSFKTNKEGRERKLKVEINKPILAVQRLIFVVAKRIFLININMTFA